MENWQRRVSAAATVYEHRGRVSHASDEEALIDLLADLMHWAASVGVDWKKVIATAEAHYEEER